jgi:HSP20 family protein
MNLRSLVPSGSRQQGGVARRDFNPFDLLQREVDRLFDDFGRGLGLAGNGGAGSLIPDIEVAETDRQIEITAELPGLERNDIDISLEGNTLTIRAEKKAETEQKDKNVRMSERSYGVFFRVLELPVTVDPSAVQATMSNGVLKITIPKPAQSQPKKIEVKEEPNQKAKQAA